MKVKAQELVSLQDYCEEHGIHKAVYDLQIPHETIRSRLKGKWTWYLIVIDGVKRCITF